MAKKILKTKGPAPDKIVMKLFAPGMTTLHRAGLGGLACTLKYIERAQDDGILTEDQIPGAPWEQGRPPWQITRQSVTLDFGRPEGAGEFLKRLFALAFQLEDGIIYLPGQYGDVPPSKPVLAQIQKGITATFLSHIPTSGSRSGTRTVTYEADGHPFTVEHIAFTSYKHQGWYWLERGGRSTNHSLQCLADNGSLALEPVAVDTALIPGGMVRHSKFRATSLTDTPQRLLPLYFAIVGCLTLSFWHRPPGRKKSLKTGVLLVPEVSDLAAFSEQRRWMTPGSEKECRIAGVSDAVLQALVRLRARRLIAGSGISGCAGMQFQQKPWDKQRVPRMFMLSVHTAEDAALSLFEKAMLELPPRIASKEVATGQGKAKAIHTEYFWVDSSIRPLIAENLAAAKPWYTDFTKLMSSKDNVRKVSYERKGLHAMTEKIAWDNPGAETIVKAVHEAIRRRFGRIADENRGNPVTMKNRWKGERERWRMAFAGAKTPGQFRHSLADLWSRAGNNPVLKESWRTVLPMLADDRWKLARDLALLGLASYAARNSEEIESTETENEGEQK